MWSLTHYLGMSSHHRNKNLLKKAHRYERVVMMICWKSGNLYMYIRKHKPGRLHTLFANGGPQLPDEVPVRPVIHRVPVPWRRRSPVSKTFMMFRSENNVPVFRSKKHTQDRDVTLNWTIFWLFYCNSEDTLLIHVAAFHKNRKK